MPPDLDALGVALAALGPRSGIPVRHSLSGDWEVPLPRDVPSLHLMVEGKCALQLDAPLWTWGIDRRTLVLIRPGVVGRLRSASASEVAVLISTELDLGGEDRLGLFGLLPPALRIGGDQVPVPLAFRNTLEALVEEISAPTHGMGFVAARLCEALFVHALRVHMLEMAWNDRGWLRALIDPLLRGPLQAAARTSARDLSAQKLARAGERSRRRFGGRLRAMTGVGAGAFVRSLRLRRARDLLAEGTSSLDAIASEIGLSGRQSLCRSFRHQFGLTPAAYWRQVHQRPFPRQARRAAEAPTLSPDPSAPAGRRCAQRPR
jgi:AraC-like DNA-binding protein